MSSERADRARATRRCSRSACSATARSAARSTSCSPSARERDRALHRARGPVISGVLTRSRGDFDGDPRGRRSDRRADRRRSSRRASTCSRAMRAGRHVVTANKQLLSQHGEELFETRPRARRAAALRGGRRRRRAGRARARGVARRRRRSSASTGSSTAPPTSSSREMARTAATYDAGARRGPARSATPRPTRPTTSAAATRPRRWRSSRGWRSATPVHLDDVRYEGIEQLSSDDIAVRARARASG